MVVLICTTAGVLSLTTLIYAKERPFLGESDLQKVGISEFERVNPNLLIYPLKRLGEKARFLLILNRGHKDQYLQSLLDTRFKELVYIVDFNKTGFIAFSVDRYNTSLGLVKNRLVQISLDDRVKIKNRAAVLEKLRDRYRSGSVSWEKIQQAIDTTESLI